MRKAALRATREGNKRPLHFRVLHKYCSRGASVSGRNYWDGPPPPPLAFFRTAELGPLQ